MDGNSLKQNTTSDLERPQMTITRLVCLSFLYSHAVAAH